MFNFNIPILLFRTSLRLRYVIGCYVLRQLDFAAEGEASTVEAVREREPVARITVSQPTERVSVATGTTNTAAP